MTFLFSLLCSLFLYDKSFFNTSLVLYHIPNSFFNSSTTSYGKRSAQPSSSGKCFLMLFFRIIVKSRVRNSKLIDILELGGYLNHDASYIFYLPQFLLSTFCLFFIITIFILNRNGFSIFPLSFPLFPLLFKG